MNVKRIQKADIIGIDEAGRGPLAGPVYAAAVALPKNYMQLFKKLHAPKKLTDSKKLTPTQRNGWFLWMKQNNIPYAYASVSAKRIDKINIARASNVAAQRAYDQLIDRYKNLKKKNKRILVIADGGLNIELRNKHPFKNFPKADEMVPAVSLASIVAKIMRDRYMCRLHKKYPQYEFKVHKGYGTATHYRALKKHGASSAHRLTFLASLRTMKKKKN